MAYLGRGLDKISNIEVLDNITFDGSSSYSITKGSVAFTPNSAQSLLISIDGVVQATNFSVNSSTIDFGVAIPSTSVCNFFLHYGTGVAFTPSDGSVTTAKLGSNAVTTAKITDANVTSTKLSYPLTTFSSTGIDDNADATAMTIDSSENVLINATSSVGTGKFQSANNSGYCSTMYSIGNGADYIQFWNGSEVGSIKRVGGTGVSYNTSSDYRLKENVVDIEDATTRLKQLKPKRFNFIADANTTVDGFLAHEVQSVVPEAISGEKDAVDENGNPEYQGIDQSKLVPLLVKTIQELEARITALESE